MPREQLVLRVSVGKLLVGLLVTVIPICLVGLYTITRTSRSMEEMAGNQFRTLAATTAAEISQFVHDRVVAVGTLATSPTVVETVTTANRAYSGMSDQAFSEKVVRVEKMWNTPQADPMVADILSSRASALLQRYQRVDRRFLRITMTDRRGATIAGTHKTLDYYQADEDFWQAVYAEGRGVINLTDVLYDNVTKANYIGVGVPIVDEGTNHFIGMIDALIDVSSILQFVHRTQPGNTGRTILVKEDGTIISAANVTLSMNRKSDEYAAIQDAAQTLQGMPSGYISAALRDGQETLIGFADTGLKTDYQNLGWVVMVAQSAREALAPVRGVIRLIGFLVLVGLAMVAFLAVYFSLHRRQTYTDLREEMPSSPQESRQASA